MMPISLQHFFPAHFRRILICSHVHKDGLEQEVGDKADLKGAGFMAGYWRSG